MKDTKKPSLLNNSRFYILVSSLLLSILVAAWLRVQIESDQLFVIRTQQVFGFLGVLYWYLALVISPLGYVFGKRRISHIEFARRAIGVSAFYFTFLHGATALWGQLGGLGQIGMLPSIFKWSLLAGAVALFILLIKAATSLDIVVNFMTYRRWKLLHRIGYVGGVLAVLHIWTIGTHLSYTGYKAAAFLALVVLAGLELFRVIKLINDKYLHLSGTKKTILWVLSWAVLTAIVASIPKFVVNFHSRHTDHSSAHSQGHSH